MHIIRIHSCELVNGNTNTYILTLLNAPDVVCLKISFHNDLRCPNSIITSLWKPVSVCGTFGIFFSSSHVGSITSLKNIWKIKGTSILRLLRNGYTNYVEKWERIISHPCLRFHLAGVAFLSSFSFSLSLSLLCTHYTAAEMDLSEKTSMEWSVVHASVNCLLIAMKR